MVDAFTEPRFIAMVVLPAVTAFAMDGDRAMILESGCDAYVAKPFNLVEFLQLVSRYTQDADPR